MPAPYSDNLYSAADSSDDDLDALSPTDGYFHAFTRDAASPPSHPFDRSAPSIPRRSNVLVADPTLAGPEAKAWEAEAERAQLNRDEATASTAARSPTGHYSPYQPPNISHSPPGHSHRRSVDEEHSSHSPSIDQVVNPYIAHRPPALSSPLFPHHREAPPAYTPSPSSPPSGYQTFGPSNSTMGLPEEQQRLIPRPPESMGGTPGTPGPSRWQKARGCITGANLRKNLKSALGSLLIFSVVFMLFSSFTLRPSHKDPDVIEKDPVKNPNMDHSDLTWNPIKGCFNGHLQTFRSTVTVETRYNRNLSIVQTIQEDNKDVSGWSPHVTGDVILRPTESASPGTIEIEVLTNGDHLEVGIQVDKETQTIKLVTPRKVEWKSGDEGPCIQIRVTAWIPREAILNDLTIETVHLDVSIQEGFILGVLQKPSILTIIGDVKTPLPKHDDDDNVLPYTLATREIYISTISGDIQGWFPLYDVLDVKSNSGQITAEVGPKPANPESVQPAVLRAKSLSGDLSITEPINTAAAAVRPDKEFPPRDYIVELNTASGDIKAEVAVSSRVQVSSQSGDLKLRLWPVLDSELLKGGEDKRPEYITDTKSGESDIVLLEPLWTSLATIGEMMPPMTDEDLKGIGEPYLLPSKKPAKISDSFSVADVPVLSVLYSKHTSISGDIRLKYPSSWEGSLVAKTISGSQDVRGDGLQIDRDSRPWSKKIRGSKGKGRSRMDIDSVSGDEDVLIGTEVGKKNEE